MSDEKDNPPSNPNNIPKLWRWALCLGVLFLMVSLFGFYFKEINNTINIGFFASGMGLIFYAFGSEATITEKIWSMTGVAASTLIIFYVINYVENSQTEKHLTVSVKNNNDFSALAMGADADYVIGGIKGKKDNPNNPYHFVVLTKNLKSANNVTLTFNPGKDPKTENEVVIFVPTQEFSHHLGNEKTLDLIIQKTSNSGSDFQVCSNQFTKKECYATNDNNSESNTENKGSWFNNISVISSAFAQSEILTLENNSTAKNIQELIKDLKSDDHQIRRPARSDLAQIGTPIVDDLVKLLLKKDVTYRERLGALVALTEMIRENKKDATDIQKMIDEKGLNTLLDASTDEDRTIRIYATEFLYDLADIRLIKPAIKRFKDTTNLNGHYNLMLIIKSAFGFISDKQERAKLSSELIKLKKDDTPKINTLIDKITQE